jgi:hypothetical protein
VVCTSRSFSVTNSNGEQREVKRCVRHELSYRNWLGLLPTLLLCVDRQKHPVRVLLLLVIGGLRRHEEQAVMCQQLAGRTLRGSSEDLERPTRLLITFCGWRSKPTS